MFGNPMFGNRISMVGKHAKNIRPIYDRNSIDVYMRDGIVGCDIHGYYEYFKNGKWHPTRTMGMACDRNYRTFSVLANVRNYHDQIIPIDDPRGLPDDVTKSVLKDSDRWDVDGHSHSYLYLQELLDYDIKQSWGGVQVRYVEYEWSLNPIKEYIDDMQKLVEKKKCDNVRMVFWFDN
jgi:hypothetical protein